MPLLPTSTCIGALCTKAPSFICTVAQIFSLLWEERKSERSPLNAPRARKKYLWASHLAVMVWRTQQGKEWAEITASLGHNLCLVSSSKIADTAVTLLTDINFHAWMAKLYTFLLFFLFSCCCFLFLFFARVARVIFCVSTVMQTFLLCWLCRDWELCLFWH